MFRKVRLILQNLRIKQLDKRDLGTILKWAANEGWNPGSDDAEAFYSADTSGFFGYFDGDRPISFISGVKYGKDFGFVGLYICDPELRGKGYGKLVWDHCIKSLHGRTMGLDGVIEQQDNYARSGFETAYRHIRYAGISAVTSTDDKRIKRIDESTLPSLIEYDHKFFPPQRTSFLTKWLDPASQHRSTFCYTEDGAVKGYGTIRTGHDAYRVGPLFADDERIADSLFQALIGTVHGKEVHLDLPEPNAHALSLAEQYQMEPVFETARMYKGTAPTFPLGNIYGVTTLELG